MIWSEFRPVKSETFQEPKTNPKAKKSHEQHQGIFWTIWGHDPIKKSFEANRTGKFTRKFGQNLSRKSSLGYLFLKKNTSDFQSDVGEGFGEIGGELPAKFGRRFSSFFCWGKSSEAFSTKKPPQISPSNFTTRFWVVAGSYFSVPEHWGRGRQTMRGSMGWKNEGGEEPHKGHPSQKQVLDAPIAWYVLHPAQVQLLYFPSDSVKRHLRGRHLSVLNLKFDFISDGGRTREEQIALSLKRHLFPHGGREPNAFWICFSRVHPPSEIKSNFKFKTLRRHLLKRHLTFSDSYTEIKTQHTRSLSLWGGGVACERGSTDILRHVARGYFKSDLSCR